MVTTFGHIKAYHADAIKSAMLHNGVLFGALFDRAALWDPATIDKVIGAFPKGHIDEPDLFLVLAECMANSVLHGQAEVLGFHARRRSGVLLLSFYQIPAMQSRVGVILSLARSGRIRECTTELPGGLGFPILLRLAQKITITSDYSRLQIWFRTKTST